MKFQLGIVVALLIQLMDSSQASNILGLFLTHSPSNVILHMAVVRALLEHGHNVTVITSMPINDPNPAYRHIFLKQQQLSQQDMDSMISEAKNTPPHLKIFKVFNLIKKIIGQYSEFTSDPDFVSFLKEDNHFDLMLMGYAFNDLPLGVAAHFNCPVVLSFPIQPFGHVSRMIGNPTNPAFVPFSPFMESSPMNLSGRIINFFLSIAERLLTAGLHFFSERLYDKNFPSDQMYPSLTEMKKNISLILFNHHFSEGPVRPLVPGLVEIGGIQIKDKPDPLPEDIRVFLDNSQKGAILFSLGSNAQGQHLGTSNINIIYKILSNLPYNVIWKADVEQQPGNASNILYKKWLPQDDILAHKNLKLFINHGGKGSITEAEYHEVPMVSIPIYGDHPKNAAIMQSKGHGIALNYRTLTEASFRNSVVEVLKNDKYKSAVKKFSTVYRDRPLSARENAVYWIEYVIRHRGAQHMQSPLKDLNILEENSVDVILILGLVIYLIVKFVNMFVLLSFKAAERMVAVAQKQKND